MLFGLTQNPLFDIDDADAEKITKAAANVMRHYENIPGISPKTRDWILLIQAAGSMYGPRFLAWRMEAAMRRAKTVPPRVNPSAPANVAPAATAPQPRPVDLSQVNRQPTPMPGVADPSAHRTAPPVNSFVQASPNANPRNQPGLDKLDGADMPLKLN